MEKLDPAITAPPLKSTTSFVVIVLFATLAAATGQISQAQTFNLIHTFTGGADGSGPEAGLTVDAAGNLYGTATYGGSQNCDLGCGTVFKLEAKNGNWVGTTLFSFQGGSDSAYPAARVVFGPDGTLYGTTSGKPGGYCTEGCGTVFRLQPPASFCRSITCPWTKTTLYTFTGYTDGRSPQGGDLAFDRSGNIYGTTPVGGTLGQGVVFELTHSNGGWTESVLYSFTGMSDGGRPEGGVILDSAGNLYGTTYAGGIVNIQQDNYGYGTIFELTPAGSGWTENVLYAFTGVGSNGQNPAAGLTWDGAGSFYGTTAQGGGGNCSGSGVGCGTVFHGLGYTIYSFPDGGSEYAVPTGPQAPVTLDAAGNIYGTTLQDGSYSAGNVFELTAGQYVYTSLYNFNEEVYDGNYPISNVTFDSSGNMYGTTSQGGRYGAGVVWEITP
jgi:uncharacterized repeat protein (TIGR03803 family)